jgi:NAD(P)-dependent dehydrogenase (short-subunit alcohol dehydrogenase family)
VRNLGLIIAAAGVGAAVAARAAIRAREADLRGQVVLITGGSRGLGLALARAFSAQGCRVAICARDAGELRAARADLEDRGAEVFTAECDVSDRAQVERMVDRTIGHFGRVDVLVNNAGEIEVGPVESMTVEDFERAMGVMFWGVLYPTMALLPHLRTRKTGRIVNITSIGGKVAVPHLLPYACAKFAAVGFSEGLRAELADTGIKVIAIAPGLMRTGSYLNAEFKGDHERESAWFGLSSTLPGITMSAERAARQIVSATRRGEAEKILTAPANVLARFHGLFPGATADILGAVDRLILPKGSSRERRRGRETQILRSPWMSALTILGRLAARQFLQQPGRREAPART